MKHSWGVVFWQWSSVCQVWVLWTVADLLQSSHPCWCQVWTPCSTCQRHIGTTTLSPTMFCHTSLRMQQHVRRSHQLAWCYHHLWEGESYCKHEVRMTSPASFNNQVILMLLGSTRIHSRSSHILIHCTVKLNNHDLTAEHLFLICSTTDHV